MEDGVLLNSTKDSLDHYDYHELKCVEKSISKGVTEGGYLYFEDIDKEEKMVFQDENDFGFEYFNGTNEIFRKSQSEL